MALEERFARRLRESCDDAVAAARRFEVRSVAVHQHVRDEVTIYCWLLPRRSNHPVS